MSPKNETERTQKRSKTFITAKAHKRDAIFAKKRASEETGKSESNGFSPVMSVKRGKTRIEIYGMLWNKKRRSVDEDCEKN